MQSRPAGRVTSSATIAAPTRTGVSQSSDATSSISTEYDPGTMPGTTGRRQALAAAILAITTSLVVGSVLSAQQSRLKTRSLDEGTEVLPAAGARLAATDSLKALRRLRRAVVDDPGSFAPVPTTGDGAA